MTDELLDRIPYLLATFAGGILLWEAWDLQVWGLFGAGPGLFPRAVILLIIAIGAVLSAFPGLAHEAEKPVLSNIDEGALPRENDAPSRRTVILYASGLIYLGFAAAYEGFILMCITTVLFLTWWAERRRILPALAFGTAIGVAGLVVFSMLLEVTIPLSEVDRAILRLIR